MRIQAGPLTKRGSPAETSCDVFHGHQIWEIKEEKMRESGPLATTCNVFKQILVSQELADLSISGNMINKLFSD